MNRIKNLTALAALSLLVLGLPAIASAQWRDRDDDDDYNRRSGGYNRNGQYGNYGNMGNMRSTVRNLKNRTREFQRSLDRDLDNSRYNGSNREDRLNDLAKDFRKAVNDLNNNDRQNANEVRRVLDLGRQLDRAIGRARLSYHTENLWRSIRYDLDVLADNYGYDNRNNRRNRNGGWNNGNRPSWWPF